jgi:inorganic pyrophosphatase
VTAVDDLPPFDHQGLTHVIIETPKGSRNKYKYSPETKMFECAKALTAGLTFPFDFGFVPSTRAEDDDPLDIIVLMDQPAFAGCLVHARLLGVMEAEQTKNGKVYRNDRLLAVHNYSIEYGELKSWQEVAPNFLKELEMFFVLQNQSKGEQFKVLSWKDGDAARLAINESKKMPYWSVNSARATP